MNVVAITDIQRLVASEVGKRRGIKTKVGCYSDKSDSLHIYGKDFHGAGGLQEILQRMDKTLFENLCYETEILAPMFEEARHLLAAQLAAEKDGLGKGVVAPGVDRHNFPYPPEWAF